MNLKQVDLREDYLVEESRFEPKTLQKKAVHHSGLKIGFAITLVVATVLGYNVMKLQSETQQEQQEKTKLLSQITNLKSQVDEQGNKLDAVSAASDSTNTKALGYIESIQGKLKKINDYLSRRGLRGVSFKTVNTTASNNSKGKKSNPLQLYEKYNNYLAQLVSNVAMVPMGYPRISSFTSFFGYRSNPFDFGRHEFHPGIDFRGQVGDLVKCTASGKVIFTGRAGGYGNCIKIRHTSSLETWYGHLSHINVREGQEVSVGEIIGRVGSTGRSTGPHLHYEVRKDGKPVNPVQYLTLN